MKIIQIDKDTHGAIKSLAALKGASMPETAINLIKLGLNTNVKGHE